MTFIQENASLILLHGCSLVEDFAARLHPMQTRNFQLLNVHGMKISTLKDMEQAFALCF